MCIEGAEVLDNLAVVQVWVAAEEQERVGGSGAGPGGCGGAGKSGRKCRG